MTGFSISGQIVDLVNDRIYPGTVEILQGKIHAIHPTQKAPAVYLLPGFIDSHIHIESSMLIPSEFARLATCHGTVATISDPHEIANVMGLEGIRYMIENSQQVPFHFYFGVPSCVPATEFETAGATIDAAAVDQLFREDGLLYLSEMMNFPGVLHKQEQVLEKINIAKKYGRPIDGHAPGLRGEEARAYIEAGISTDHECFTLQEALDKLGYGMKILIREGSAAKNYESLHPLIQSHPHSVMFCSDDKHPHELVAGHINELVRRSIVEHGYNTMDVLRCACYNPILHYNLPLGKLQIGDSADFIIVDNLLDFRVLKTYIQGQLVAKESKSLIERVPSSTLNHFHCTPKSTPDFTIPAKGNKIKVIEALRGQLITNALTLEPLKREEEFVSDVKNDILKIVVINRYYDAPIAKAFVKGFGLKSGAIASCIAHDSHNIVAVGTNDEDLCLAVNAIIEQKGGIALCINKEVHSLALPVAGIMTNEDGYLVANHYEALYQTVKKAGTSLPDPFMSLSFMALLVIPSLKLSDRGLFDVDKFSFTSLF